MTLGSLAWWNIPNTAGIGRDALTELLGQLKINAPAPMAPVDVFRRVASTTNAKYELDDAHVTLDCREVPSQSTMLVRHVVRTERVDGQIRSAARVGDFAFYKPPRDKPRSARVRCTPMPGGHPDSPQIVGFVEALRSTYRQALTTVDAQGIRRTVRGYLRAVGALHLEGPYFIPDPADAERLSKLIEQMDGCAFWHFTVADDERSRAMLARALPMTEEVPS